MTKFLFNGHTLYIDNKLAGVIQIFAKKHKKNNDNLLIISGDTGTGKSNLAALVCAYYSFLTGIEYNNKRVFFKSQDFIKEAIIAYDKIFHYDESLFTAMATDWQTKEQRELIKMLWLCRKRRHFYVFCIPDYFKLKDSIKEEKCNGLIYTKLKNNTPGSFEYFRKRKRQKLIEFYYKRKQKKYTMFRSFRGTFAKNLPRVLDEKIYDEDKDKAIGSLLNVPDKKEVFTRTQINFNAFKKKVALLPKELGMNQQDFAKIFGVTPKALIDWKHLPV